jgi:glucosamine-6-phosphate deaminase
MKIIRTADYQEMSVEAGKILVEKIRSNPQLTLGLATGSTPGGVYEYLIHDHHENHTSYKQAKTVNLDEYIGLSRDDSNSYHYFMRKNLFDEIDLPLEQTNIPNGTATDLQAECARYEKLIEELGGVDIQILGIGKNGHIGFNEPGTPFESQTHVVALAESTRDANSRFFSSIEEVPTHALTMGIASILKSKEILLLASGTEKAEALAKLLNGDIDESFPASALKHHKNITIIADNDALRDM